jgi:hypothetical protein
MEDAAHSLGWVWQATFMGVDIGLLRGEIALEPLLREA